MAVHDAYARLTPYELAIPGREFAETHFAEIETEAETRGFDLLDPEAFVMLAAAGAALREIRGEEDDPGLIEQYGALLFHGFHFWRSAEALYLCDLRTVRYLVESDPGIGRWKASVPSSAGYVQLPRHLFWARSDEEGPAEPLDGFFWALSASDTLSILAALGMRDDRPGLSVVPIDPVPLAEVAEWAAAEVREEEGRDFESTLPGGDLDRLYSVVTGGELLKLAALVLWYLESFPEDVGEKEGGKAGPEKKEEGTSEGRETEDGPEGPLPSSLRFRRISLGSVPAPAPGAP